jgi:hypothetical protein
VCFECERQRVFQVCEAVSRHHVWIVTCDLFCGNHSVAVTHEIALNLKADIPVACAGRLTPIRLFAHITSKSGAEHS